MNIELCSVQESRSNWKTIPFVPKFNAEIAHAGVAHYIIGKDLASREECMALTEPLIKRIEQRLMQIIKEELGKYPKAKE